MHSCHSVKITLKEYICGAVLIYRHNKISNKYISREAKRRVFDIPHLVLEQRKGIHTQKPNLEKEKVRV